MDDTQTKRTDKPKECGAKSRQGRPCKKPPMKGKRRCANHGAKSTGPTPENNHLRTHGVYSRYLTAEEVEVWPHIRVGSLDDEVKLAKIQIRRALLRSRDDPANLLFPSIIDRLIRTVCKLERTRHELLGFAAAGSANETAAAICAALAEMQSRTRAAPPTEH